MWMYKGIYDVIMFAGIGGPIMVIGGLIGLYFGFEAASDCTSRCLGGILAFFEVCKLNCPDPYMGAVYGTIPGLLIWAVTWLVKQVRQPDL
jgi:hypothetical protein